MMTKLCRVLSFLILVFASSQVAYADAKGDADAAKIAMLSSKGDMGGNRGIRETYYAAAMTQGAALIANAAFNETIGNITAQELANIEAEIDDAYDEFAESEELYDGTPPTGHSGDYWETDGDTKAMSGDAKYMMADYSGAEAKYEAADISYALASGRYFSSNGHTSFGVGYLNAGQDLLDGYLND